MRKFLSVLLAVMMVLSTVSFAVPSAVGTVDTGMETGPVPVFEEAELSADTEYGTLLFDIDFESEAFVNGEVKSGGAVQYYSSVEQPVLPENFEGYYALVGNTFECAVNDTDSYELNGTNVLKVYNNSDPSFPHVAIQSLESASNWNDNYPGFPDGTYTVVLDAACDCKNSKPALVQARFADTGSHVGGNGVGAQQDISYEMDTFSVSWDVFNQDDGSTKVVAANGAEAVYETIKSMGIYFGQMGNNPDFVYVDNFKMYYKPNTVNVTINNNGELVKVITASTKGVLVSDLVKEAGIGADFSVTEILVDGEKKILSDTVVFGADAVVDITSEKLDLSAFEDSEKGKMLFNITFEEYVEGTTLNNSWYESTCILLTDASKTPYADAVMSHDLKYWGIFGQGATYTIMEDPNNPENLVVGAENVTSTSYPQFRIDTGRDSQERTGDRADAPWGFVEEDGGVFTLEYDFMDVNGVLNTTDRFGGQSSIGDTILKDAEDPDQGYYNKWNEFEDTPLEKEGEKVAGEYRTNSSVYSDEIIAKADSRMGSTAEISFIKIHSAAPTNNSYYIDNVRLWYKPGKADITVKSIGAPLGDVVLEDVKTTGITSAELLALIDTSSVSSTKYSVKGISLDENGTELVDSVVFAGDTTLYLVWEEIDMSEWMDENGIILFEMTFDGIADGTKIKHEDKLSTFGRVNPYISGSDNWFINLSGYGTVANNDYGVVTDGALKFIKTADGQWSQIQFSNEKNGNVLISDGTIYKEAEMKVVSATSGISLGLTGYAKKYNSETGKWEGSTGNQNSVQTIGNVTSDSWYTLSGSKELEGAEYNSESCTIFLPTYPAKGGIGDEFYIDNIRLYWRPATANVTVKHIGNDLPEVLLKNVTTAGISAAEILTLAGIETNINYKVKGISFNENGSDLKDVATFAGDTTLYIVWEKVDMSDYIDENGILLFDVDFDDIEVGTAVESDDKLSTLGTVNPYFAKSDKYAIQLSTFTNGRVTDFDNDGNPELAVDYGTGGQYPQVLLGLTTNELESALTGGGTYYAETTYYVPSSLTDLRSVGLTNNGIQDGVHKGTAGLMGYSSIYTSDGNFKFNTWTTLSGAKNTKDAGIDDITKITNLFTMSTGTQACTVYLDDIKLYWRPDTVNVTIDAGDNADVEDVTFEMKTTGVAVEDVMGNMLDWGSKKLTGLSLTEGGEALPAGTILSPCSDVTYYAVWGEFGTLLEGYGADFNGKVTYDEITWATYGLGANTDEVYSYSMPVYTEGNTSYMSLKASVAEGATGIIDAQLRLDQPMPKGAATGMAIRMRLTGFPDSDYVVETESRQQSVTAHNLEVIKMYYSVGSLSLAESRTLHANKDWTTGLFDGKWMTLYFDLTAKTDFAENNLNYFRIDIPDGFPADAVVDIDYIHFYGDNSLLADKPVSNSAVSIRTGKDGDTRNGMRFKATMTGKANAEATEYGWVVVDSSKVNTNAITRGSGSAVKTYYAREAGVDKVNFLDSDNDNALVFSAVVYNIKPEYAKKAIVIRPFITVDGVDYYGAPVVKSIYDLACEYRNSEYAGLDDEDKTYIEGLLAVVEAE